MAAIFYSKITGIILALATIAGLIGFGVADLLNLSAPLDLGIHALTAVFAIYVGFSANRNLAITYAKVSSLLFLGLAIFGMYQGHPYGNISAHLAMEFGQPGLASGLLSPFTRADNPVRQIKRSSNPRPFYLHFDTQL